MENKVKNFLKKGVSGTAVLPKLLDDYDYGGVAFQSKNDSDSSKESAREFKVPNCLNISNQQTDGKTANVSSATNSTLSLVLS